VKSKSKGDKRAELVAERDELVARLRKVQAELSGYVTPAERAAERIKAAELRVKAARKLVEDGESMSDAWKGQYLVNLVYNLDAAERELRRLKGEDVPERTEQERAVWEAGLRRKYGYR
jgi:Tfp pilus assembly protein FimV